MFYCAVDCIEPTCIPAAGDWNRSLLHIRKLKFQNLNIHPMSRILSNYMHTNIVITWVKSGFRIYAQSTQYVKERALAVPRICICESICLPLNNAIQSIYVLTERSTIDLSRALRRHANSKIFMGSSGWTLTLRKARRVWNLSDRPGHISWYH